MKKIRIDEKKRAERLEVIKRIEEYEKLGKFDTDTESDPESRILHPEDINYLDARLFARIKRGLAFLSARFFFFLERKKKKVILNTPLGIENLNSIKGGSIITANHFNPYDSFIMQKVFDSSSREGKMYRIIREGNYTSFPGFYGFLMRNCNTLPLSSDRHTAVKLSSAVKTVLNDGSSILIYPEGSMWYNYRKPKPLKSGAFDLAVRHGVPVVPCFIVMKNSGIIGEDGMPVLAHTPIISEPIYPDLTLSKKEASDKMRRENFEVFKRIYEREYGLKLRYSFEGAV
jgi:1-acyl-sn-glycerol-3-phosphate acyltransferase